MNILQYNSITKQHNKLVIFDRDGVLNYDKADYVRDVSELNLIECVGSAIYDLNRAGFIVSVATNQAGISKGLYTHEILQNIHTRLVEELSAQDAYIHAIAYCCHADSDMCICRKPKPGMLNALYDLYVSSLADIDKNQIWFIGDKLGDMQAAETAGMQGVLVKTGQGQDTLKNKQLPENILIFNSLKEISNALIKTQNLR